MVNRKFYALIIILCFGITSCSEIERDGLVAAFTGGKVKIPAVLHAVNSRGDNVVISGTLLSSPMELEKVDFTLSTPDGFECDGTGRYGWKDRAGRDAGKIRAKCNQDRNLFGHYTKGSVSTGSAVLYDNYGLKYRVVFGGDLPVDERGLLTNDQFERYWQINYGETISLSLQTALRNMGITEAQLAGLSLDRIDKPRQVSPRAEARDTSPPTINLAKSIAVKSDNPTIRGRVVDNERVAWVTVEGRETDLQPDGSFSFTRYVPASGTTVEIVAIDEWGNKAQKTVRLTRTITDTSDQLTFASLDPTNINGQANRNAVALVIGVADYTRAPDALYADSDASVFGDYARRALGIPKSSIKVLTNGDASLVDLKVSVRRWLRGRIEEGKTDVYVFYAGHGLASSDGEELYLLPHNGEPSLLKETSLLRNDLFDVIAAANPKSATVFLDTCYSGLSRGEETLLASARPILITSKHQAAPKGFTVFSAASGLQISSGLDEAKHGLFSYYLMKGLEGPADANGDKTITAGELHSYIHGNVKRQAIRLGREQVPELSGDTGGVLVRWR